MENPADSTNGLNFSSDRLDLSDLAARVDIACLCLNFFEPGLWWDTEKHRRAISHPAFLQWMDLYGFTSLSLLPVDALISLCSQLERRVTQLNNIDGPAAFLPPGNLPDSSVSAD